MLRVSKFIHILHKFANEFFFFSCSGDISKLTGRQQVYLENNFYCDNGEIVLDIPNTLRYQLVESQQTETCIANKEALEYCMMTVPGITHITY